jgi:predicted nucleotidyltransferase component of viral defense system
MERMPLHDRLRKRGHREVAMAQDLLVSAAYDAFPALVLHGGTAIWRCFGGSRFSEDVDAYLPPPVGADAMRALNDVLVARGFVVRKLKRSRNAIYARLSYAGAEVRFEALVKEPGASVVRTFEMVDGSRIAVNTLSPEALLAEKARAYVDRRKVRDLFDVFFLLSLASRGPEVEASVGELIDGFVPPVDERALKALVISGAVPTTEGMVEAIRSWARRST